MTASQKSPGSGRTWGLHLVLAVVGTVMAVPLLYAALSGFKSTDELSRNPVGLPESWVASNYTQILGSGDFWRLIGNSTLIAIGTTVLIVAVSALSAFSFARFAFRGREALFTLFTMGLMFPFAVAALPLFLLLRSLDLLDNPLGVILPQAAFGLPMTIIILRGFFRQIPGELEEAATLDGCSSFGFFWRVLLPMARPALGTVSVLAVVTSWNNFFLPLLVFTDAQWWTLPIGVQQFQGQYSADYAKVFAYLVLAMVPALAFYSVAERQLVGGLTAGATKG
ncbi:raffinose/stachyose/melibiose transport system permease protein [Streptomyces luteogriseus]|uniref:Raffinose/stachyose/melibiose transport system permease protein n=2 Tax=Streptomyces TaxID=1883 RepID=A0A7W7DV93_9ACTN|nr:raffinose/stachyose/melibiose transport system permease protein [Streptomyces luteogriseus]